MSNDNATSRKPQKTPLAPVVRDCDAVAGAKPPAPDIVKLEIDENDDLGCDPYNRTGAYCVLKFDDDV